MITIKAILADNLSKVFGENMRAVDGVSFSLEPGEIFGFLGPNGAGKTTTVKLLSGMMTPTEGAAKVFDVDPAISPETVHGMAGVVTDRAQMYDNLTGRQNLLFFGAMFGMEKPDCKQRAGELLERLDLVDAADRKLGTYSTGMRQRLSLARAMLHRPKILFLDEPTSGLDPESAKSVNDMIKHLAHNEGVTVFLCTHQLRYAEEICTSYGLVDNGALLQTGTLSSLRASVSSGLTLLVKANNLPRDMAFAGTKDGLSCLTIRDEQEIPGIVKRLVEAGAEVYHVSSLEPTLEEIYFALIEKRRPGGQHHD